MQEWIIAMLVISVLLVLRDMAFGGSIHLLSGA